MRLPEIIATDRRPAIDEVQRDAIVEEIRRALTADLFEEQIAEHVYEIHLRIRAKHELYQEVWHALGSRLRNAAKQYIAMHEARQ